MDVDAALLREGSDAFERRLQIAFHIDRKRL